MGVSRDCPIFLGYPLLSQERVKLRTSNFACTFIGSIGTKQNFGISSHGCSQGHPKFSGHPYIGCIARSSLRQLSFLVVNTIILILRIYIITLHYDKFNNNSILTLLYCNTKVYVAYFVAVAYN